MNGNTHQRNRRERPACRSGNIAITTCAHKTEPPPDMSFRGSAASRGIFPSSKFYLVLVLPPTWWIPPLRLRCGRNDRRFFALSVTNSNVPRFRPSGPVGGRLPPLQWVYHVSGGTIHLHRLYVPRGGRQIAAPTSKLLQIPYIERIQCRFYVLKNTKNDVHYRSSSYLLKLYFSTRVWYSKNKTQRGYHK